MIWYRETFVATPSARTRWSMRETTRIVTPRSQCHVPSAAGGRRLDYLTRGGPIRNVATSASTRTMRPVVRFNGQQPVMADASATPRAGHFVSDLDYGHLSFPVEIVTDICTWCIKGRLVPLDRRHRQIGGPHANIPSLTETDMGRVS